jgi:hypothetical protein
MSEGPQRILQRALLGEAIDCAEGTAVFVWNDERHYVASSFTRRDGERIDIEWVTLRTRVAGLEYRVSLVWPADDPALAR